jgi:lipid-binding SYLF domain-containing protein
MRRASLFTTVLGAVAILLTACSTEPATQSDRTQLHSDGQAALATMRQKDPTLNDFLSSAYGYAIFPDIGKGAAGVGGAFGRAEVYEQNNMCGYADLTQGTVGVALGGQEYAELLVFQNKETMDHFKAGNLEFAAQVSGVAVTAGGAASAKFQNGVAVFLDVTGGLMGEASIGGQKFNFQPPNAPQ